MQQGLENLQPNINPELLKHHEAVENKHSAKKTKIHGIINPGAERVDGLRAAIRKQQSPKNAKAIHNRVVNKPPLNVQIEQGLTKIRDEFGVEIAEKILGTLKTHKRMEKPQLMTAANFSTYLSKHKFDPPSWLASLGPEEPIVIVWRGCEMESLVHMMANESASRNEKYDLNVAPPSEEAARIQVGEGVGNAQLPEFTRLPNIANQFGRGNITAAFAIPVKYLTPGSGVEGGYVCARSAPTSLIGWEEGKSLENIPANIRGKMRIEP